MQDYSECDSRFRPLLADIDGKVLNGTYNTVYGLWPDLTLAYMNPAWFVFAFENGGDPAISKEWGLGRCALEAAPEVIRPFYEFYFRRVLKEDRPWEHTYECSSDAVDRKFHLAVLPLSHCKGLLLVNSLVFESERCDDSSSSPVERHYEGRHGFICQCCHCRRFRRVDQPHTWDWVPLWIRQPPQKVSHGICETCRGFYYCERRIDEDHPQLISTIFD